MLKHYLIAAWSNCRRTPLAAGINVLTLALGLVSFIFASSIMGFWSHADQQFANAGRTVVVTNEWHVTDGSGTGSGGSLPYTTHRTAAYLDADFPQIEAVARLAKFSDATPVRAGDQATRMRAFAADADFLRIFDLPMVEGETRTALSAPGSVVLTRQAALRLYGDADPVGRPIALYGDIDATVTAVLDRIPEPSHLGRSAAAPVRFDILTSRDLFERFLRAGTGGKDSSQLPDEWAGAGGNITYVLLPDDGSLTAAMLRAELPAFVERHVPEDERSRIHVGLDVVPVGNLLAMAVRDALFPRESAMSVPLLILVLGAIVLTVACVNFANLATARAAGRTHEVGVRKAIGAGPRQVIAQYLLEAGMQTGAALALSMALVVLLVPVLGRTTGIDLRMLWSASLSGWGVPALFALGLGVTLAAGLYPAVVLSRVQPALAVRAAPGRHGARSLATLLVGVQFAFAAFLLIVVGIVYEQNVRLEHAGHATTAEPLLVIENSPEFTGLAQETLRKELLGLSQVVSTTASQQLPWASLANRIPLSASASASAVEHSALLYVVGYDFFRTFDISLVAGREFDPQRADDVAMTAPGAPRTQNIVISRALAREFGYSPEDVVDRTVYIPSSLTGGPSGRPFHVIGVVEDKALAIASRYGQRPNAYLFAPGMRFHIVRLVNLDVGAGLAAIDALWKRLVPNVAIERRFLADYFDESYANFARINQAFAALALIAWSISTIGLYAMAILVSGGRVREIAIRKTLGARTSHILLMLLGGFSKPVVIANVIAWPFAYWAGRAYLSVFVDPSPLTIWPFATGLAASLAIAWLAVVSQTWRAAASAPMRVIRAE